MNRLTVCISCLNINYTGRNFILKKLVYNVINRANSLKYGFKLLSFYGRNGSLSLSFFFFEFDSVFFYSVFEF